MAVAAFSLFPQNVYQSSLSLICRGLDCPEFQEFVFTFLQLLLVAVVTGTSYPSFSETCFFLLRPLLVTTVPGSPSTVGGEEGLQTKTGSGC